MYMCNINTQSSVAIFKHKMFIKLLIVYHGKTGILYAFFNNISQRNMEENNNVSIEKTHFKTRVKRYQFEYFFCVCRKHILFYLK